jgi:hypothetical protein
MSSSHPSQDPHSSFEDDHLDIPLAVSQPSMLSASLELGRSILLSRPFLLAVIVFLSYRLWVSSRSRPTPSPAEKPSSSDRLSLRKSIRPSISIRR